jgi:hypothetical protein
LFQVGLVAFGEKQVSIERKSSVLEAAASNTLFPVKIELVFDRRPSCYLGCPSHMLSVPN